MFTGSIVPHSPTDVNGGGNAVLESAQGYAEMGLRVLPLVKNKKHPACKNGVKDASNDVETINNWWAKNPACNLGIAGGNGLIVIDVDVKNGKNGVADINRIFTDAGEPSPIDSGSCPMAKTPSGGYHLFYRCEHVSDYKNGVGIAYQGKNTAIDIRADNGYVVAAPSTISTGDNVTAYQWVRRLVPIAKLPELPACLANVLPKQGDKSQPLLTEKPQPATQERSLASVNTDVSSDINHRILRYLDRVDAAVAGQGGHDTTIRVLGRLQHGFDLSQCELQPYAEYYNQTKCEPPWSEEELKHKIEDAVNKWKPSDGSQRGHLLTDNTALTEQRATTRTDTQFQKDVQQTERKTGFIQFGGDGFLDQSVNDFLECKRAETFNLGWEDGSDRTFDHMEICPNNIITIGGVPGIGKTAFIAQLVGNLLWFNPDITVVNANIEMGRDTFFKRELCRWSGIPQDVIRNPTPDSIEKYKEDIDDAFKMMGQTLFSPRHGFVDFSKDRITLEDIFEEAEDIGSRVVVLDYIQKIPSRNQKDQLYSDISERITLCRRFANKGNAVIVVTALARNNQNGKAYQDVGLGSGAGSSEIEYSADVLLMLTPETKYDKETKSHKPIPGKVVGNVIKNRHGTTGFHYFDFDSNHLTFIKNAFYSQAEYDAKAGIARKMINEIVKENSTQSVLNDNEAVTTHEPATTTATLWEEQEA